MNPVRLVLLDGIQTILEALAGFLKTGNGRTPVPRFVCMTGAQRLANPLRHLFVQPEAREQVTELGPNVRGQSRDPQQPEPWFRFRSTTDPQSVLDSRELAPLF